MSKCPKCGAVLVDRIGNFLNVFDCGTEIYETHCKRVGRDCLRNQLAQVTKERDQLRETIAAQARVIAGVREWATPKPGATSLSHQVAQKRVMALIKAAPDTGEKEGKNG